MKKKNIILLCLFTIIITFSISVSADGCGESALSDFLNKMYEHIYSPIKLATPILFLVLTSFDFAKVVFSGDEKGMDKAKKNFLKRGVAALIIFFAPEIIKLIAEFANNQSISSCVPE